MVAKIQGILKWAAMAMFPLVLQGCNATDGDPASPIRILQPKAGDRFKASDTIKIITETDYHKVAGNLSAVFSPDSGKSWDLILSAAHKDMLARDTFPFVATDLGFSAGQSVKIQVWEYGVGGIREDIGFVHID